MKKQVLKIYQPSPKSNHHLLYRNLMFFYSWHFSVLIKMSHLTFSLSTAKEFGLLYLVFNVAIDIFLFLNKCWFLLPRICHWECTKKNIYGCTSFKKWRLNTYLISNWKKEQTFWSFTKAPYVSLCHFIKDVKSICHISCLVIISCV